MSKVARAIAVVAGTVALIATGVGAIAGASFAATAAGQTVAAIGSYATLAATAASVVASVTATAPPQPPARGSVTDVIVAIDAPSPYVMGEGYAAGVLRYDAAYGEPLGSGENAIPNPYRFQLHAYSVAGPCASLGAYVDREPYSGGWYDGFFFWDIEHGDRPGRVLTPGWPSPPGYDSTSKMSGVAHAAWSYGFDGKGEKFASGLPEVGLGGFWVKAYDPRFDSTQTAIGGSGPQRLDDEGTWEWTDNPALHAGTYAYGRYVNGKRVFGCGLTEFSSDAIAWADIAAWASVCFFNNWTIFGRIFEPGNRWENLKNIAAAGGAKPYIANGVLHFNWQAPRVALDTITSADLASLDGSVTGMRTRFERLNTIYPQFISPENGWEFVTGVDAVTDAGYVAEDGQVRQRTWPFYLVKSGQQAAQLAAYELANMRELSPILLTCKERLREYGPGDCLHLEIPELGLDTDAVVMEREYDHASMTTRFTLIGETPAKHAFAMGRTTQAPPTASLVAQDAEQRDSIFAASRKPFGWQLAIIRSAAVRNPRDDLDIERPLLTATDAGSSVTISVAKHDWDYPSEATDITRAQGTITGLEYGLTYFVYFDDGDLTNTAPTYVATIDPAEAQNSSSFPSRHPLGRIRTPMATAPATNATQAPGYGYNTTAELDFRVNQSIDQDGSIIPAAIPANAVSQATFDEWTDSLQRSHTVSDYRYINQGGLIFTDGGDVFVHAELLLNVSYTVSGLSAGDTIDGLFAITRWSGGAPATNEDLADYIAAGATLVADGLLLIQARYDGLITSGSVVSEFRNLTLEYLDVAPPADGYWYAIWAKVTTPGTINTKSYQRMRLLELKK